MVTAQRSLGSFTTVLFGHEQGKYPDGNSVLVRGTHSSVLIDPSLSVHAADPPIEVDRVLLTHAHEDHMAGVSSTRAGTSTATPTAATFWHLRHGIWSQSAVAPTRCR